MDQTTKVFIDTNFLLIPALFKVDIFAEIERICSFNYELIIVDKTLDELKNIIASASKNTGKHKAAAKLGLQLAENAVKTNKLKIFQTNKDDKVKAVDRILLEIAKNGKIIAATQDKQLKKYLRLLGARIIDLRKKQYLILT
ncbi:hypothetical protein HYU06_02880 [Candidatus Woesearchaeota archaeon]|nr:hypothetical protein [Candidatus Woesearchaeota archaeon]